MSRQGGGPAATAAFFFIALILLAVLVAVPGWKQGSWKERAAALAQIEIGMTSNPRLHAAVDPPQFQPPAPFCGTCHSLPPHGGKGSQPAFLNHHATLLDCLVCHWAGISGSRPAPFWDIPGETREGASLLRLSPPPGGGGRDVAALRGAVIAQQVCFDRGPSCGDCHAPGRFDAYLRPELSRAAARELEELPEIFTLLEGKKWYFPQRR